MALALPVHVAHPTEAVEAFAPSLASTDVALPTTSSIEATGRPSPPATEETATPGPSAAQSPTGSREPSESPAGAPSGESTGTVPDPEEALSVVETDPIEALLRPYRPRVPVADGYASLYGASRYDTSALIARAAYPSGASIAVLATGENWADALAGSSLAGVLDAPLLLSQRDVIPAVIASALDDLGVRHIVLLGGENALGATVEESVRASGRTVERLGGVTLYDTADLIARRVLSVHALRGNTWDGRALIATGRSFQDALAASPIAAAKGWPLLLVDPRTGLSDFGLELRDHGGLTSAVILGGERAVPESVAESLRNGSVSVLRKQGAGWADTAAEIARWSIEQGLSPNGVGIATGEQPYDALGGGVLQARRGSVLLLSGRDLMPAAAQGFVAAYRPDIRGVIQYGGMGVLSWRIAVQTAIARGLDTDPTIADVTIAEIPARRATGSAHTPTPKVGWEGRTLTEGVDYRVSYWSNILPGTASMRVVGLGLFSGDRVVTFRIDPIPFDEATLVFGRQYRYTGARIQPKPTVTLAGRRLVEGLDYRFTYEGNVGIGIATVSAVGIGKYAGTVTERFTISDKTSLEIAFDIRPMMIGNLRYRYDPMPAWRYQRTGKILVGGRASSITVHNTAVPNVPADNFRRSHLNNDLKVSWHVTVDDREAILHLPLNEEGWHTGTRAGNSSSIGIEVCEFTDPTRRARAEANARQLIADMLTGRLGRRWDLTHLSAGDIRTHLSWEQYGPGLGKYCPRLILPHWSTFVSKTRSQARVVAEPRELVLMHGSTATVVKHVITPSLTAGYQVMSVPVGAGVVGATSRIHALRFPITSGSAAVSKFTSPGSTDAYRVVAAVVPRSAARHLETVAAAQGMAITRTGVGGGFVGFIDRTAALDRLLTSGVDVDSVFR